MQNNTKNKENITIQTTIQNNTIQYSIQIGYCVGQKIQNSLTQNKATQYSKIHYNTKQCKTTQ